MKRGEEGREAVPYLLCEGPFDRQKEFSDLVVVWANPNKSLLPSLKVPL